jgi:hypothetical protein
VRRREYLEVLGLDGNIILKWVSEKLGVKGVLDWI